MNNISLSTVRRTGASEVVGNLQLGPFRARLLTESFKTYVPDDKLSIVFGNAQNVGDCQDGNRPEFLPTLLHFSAMYGLRDLTAALLQCPGAVHAYGTANCDGDFPTNLAEKSGHWELRDFMHTYMEVAAMVHDDYGKNSMQTSQIMSSMFYGQYLSFPGGSEIPEDIYVPIDTGGGGPLATPSGYVPMHAASSAASLPQSVDYDYMIKRMLESNPEEPEKDYEELDILGPPIVAERRPSVTSSVPPPPPPPRDDKKHKGSLEPQDTPLLLLPTIHSNMSPAQEELISLQKQVKNGELTINQAVFRFKEWERKHKERAASFQYQQENLQRIRNSLMRTRQDRKKKGESTTIKISDPLVTGSSTYDVVLLKTRKDIMDKPTNGGESKPMTGNPLIHDLRPAQHRQNEYSREGETSFRNARSSFKKASFTAPPAISPELPRRTRHSLATTSDLSSRSSSSSITSGTTGSEPPIQPRPLHIFQSPIDQYGGHQLPGNGQGPPLPPRDDSSRRPPTNEPRPAVPPRSPIYR